MIDKVMRALSILLVGFFIGFGMAHWLTPSPSIVVQPPLPTPTPCITTVFEGWDAFTQADAWAKDHPVDKVVWHEPYVLAIYCEKKKP